MRTAEQQPWPGNIPYATDPGSCGGLYVSIHTGDVSLAYAAADRWQFEQTLEPRSSRRWSLANLAWTLSAYGLC